MNSVRAILGTTQVGGRSRRRYGGGAFANYKFNCNCNDFQPLDSNVAANANKIANPPQFGPQNKPTGYNAIVPKVKSQGLSQAQKYNHYMKMTEHELEKEFYRLNSLGEKANSTAQKEFSDEMDIIRRIYTNNKKGTGKLQASFLGGARKRKARKATSSRKANAEKYRKFLDGLDVKRLQKIAKTKGIKITKKKDGKTVYCKKATIVSKLFKFKYGK
jgi:hypothetical protein